MLRILKIAVLFLLALPMCADAIEPLNSPRPVIIARKITASELAGKTVMQAMFAQPANVARLDHVRRCRVPKQNTEVRVAYDDSNLYVAFRSFEKNLNDLIIARKTRDASIWKDDSVFVMVNPTTAKTPKSYYFLGTGVECAQYDEKDVKFARAAWNGEWNAETGKEPDAWTALITVPFKTIGASAPKLGDSWGINFQRCLGKREEASFWAPVRVDIRESERAGKLVFGTEKAPIITTSKPVIKTPGKQSIDMHVSNPTGKPLPLTVNIINDAKVIQSINTKANAGDSNITINYNYPMDGWHELNISITGPENRLLALTPVTLVRLDDFDSQITKYQKIVNALKPVDIDKLTVVNQLKSSLTQLKAEVDSAKNNVDNWKALKSKIADAEQATERVVAMCADKDNKGYIVGTETALTKVLRDKLFEGKYGVPAKISAARNEYESTQVVVVAHSKDLKNVTVTSSELTGPNGAKISANNVQLNVVGYVETRIPAYEIEYMGWWPDPLMDNDPFDVTSGKHQPIWITVNPPAGIPAGTYKGEITIKPANAAAAKVPLEVKVWDFDMPTAPHMKTAFAYFPYELGGWYGDRRYKGMEQEYQKFLLQHNINPCNIYNKEPIFDMKDVEWMKPLGLNMVHLGNINYVEGNSLTELIERLKGYKRRLDEQGAGDMAYIYGFDETGPDNFPNMNYTWGEIGKQVPGIKRMCTVIPSDEIRDCVDIFVPLTGDWQPEHAQNFAKDGTEVWWYICCDPVHPYPNVFVDYPAIDPRILFWMNWKYQVPGVLYYAINLWDTNFSPNADGNLHYDKNVVAQMGQGKRWPEIPWNSYTCASFNGDGHLIYPGPKGNPLSSIRFEAVRDGIDDYEYFYILNDLVQKAKNNPKADKTLLAKAQEILKVNENVVKSLCEYTQDPQELYKAREEVAATIEKLSKMN